MTGVIPLETPQNIAAQRDARPDILMIMVDQRYCPGAGCGDAGFANDIETILSFIDSLDGNEYTQHYSGFRKLREYARAFIDRTIAESARIPRRGSIMTGQYGPRSRVTQTDGLFKNGDASNFSWLRADGAPTAGDYFREIGYSTHCFVDSELSWPEPRGALSNNMGVYRPSSWNHEWGDGKQVRFKKTALRELVWVDSARITVPEAGR